VKILLNESDFDGIKQNLITYLNSIPEFQGYNFNAGSLSVFIRVAVFVIRNLSFQLNRTVAEIFMDSALLEDSIYSLIQNFNFLPEGKRPAKRYLNINYDLDSYTASSDSTFKIYFNRAKYTEDIYFVPTLRDKWQQNAYDDVDIANFQNQNLFYCPLTKTSNQLETTIPVYQANWEAIEETGLTSSNQIIDLKDPDGNYYADKVIKDSIRVFVKEIDEIWYEYFNIKEGNFDSTDLRSFNLIFDKEKGISVQFGIDHLSRVIGEAETVRIFFPVTEGDEVNTIQGNNQFTVDDFIDFQIFEVQPDGTEILIAERNDGDPVLVSPANLEDLFSARLLDGENELAFFDNGVEKQSLESIKINAPLFRTTQGRAVTENDYNFILQNKFSEYADIRAWGGQREFFDIEELIDEELAIYSPKDAIKRVLMRLQSEGDISIRDVDYSSIESGKFRRDLGFVYYTFYDEGFNFVNSEENISEIVRYLDRFKILTIFYKYMNPVFNLLKPKIKVTLNPSFASEFSILTMKKEIFKWINSRSGFNKKIDLADLNSFLLGFDSIDVVDSIKFTTKVKYLHGAENTVRTFNRFLGNQSVVVRGWDSEWINLGTLTTEGEIVKLNGNVVGICNPRIGAIQFSGVLAEWQGKPLILDGFKFGGLKINSLRESVVGVEKTIDIEVVGE